MKTYRYSVEQLKELAMKIAANDTPSLLERWAEGMELADVVCPFGVKWSDWVRQVREGGFMDRLPWQR